MLWENSVKDDNGFWEVFAELGASALQVAMARFLDAISRLPGMAGEAHDAVLADTRALAGSSLHAEITGERLRTSMDTTTTQSKT